MRFEFKPCPDCGYNTGFPSFDRNIIRDDNGKIVCSMVSAYCPECGWKTNMYENVKLCADEWNSAIIYDDDKDYMNDMSH